MPLPLSRDIDIDKVWAPGISLDRNSPLPITAPVPRPRARPAARPQPDPIDTQLEKLNADTPGRYIAIPADQA